MGTQAEGAAEKLAQRRDGHRDLANPVLRERVCRGLEAFAPDLVVWLNRVGLPHDLDDRWASLLARTPWVGWLCDNLNEPPPNQEPRFRKVFYFDSGCLPALRDFYGAEREQDFLYLPLAVNPGRYPLQPEGPRRESLVFVGKCSAHRRRFFGELRQRSVPLQVYGPGAGDWLRPWRSRRLNSRAVARLYASHAVCLNLLQPGNTECGLNLRAFEVPCAGGVSLYPRVPDLDRCFEPGEEVLAYRDAAEIAECIVPLLGEAERLAEIRRAGRKRVLADHTFEHRARRILQAVGLGDPRSEP